MIPVRARVVPVRARAIPVRERVSKQLPVRERVAPKRARAHYVPVRARVYTRACTGNTRARTGTLLKRVHLWVFGCDAPVRARVIPVRERVASECEQVVSTLRVTMLYKWVVSVHEQLVR